MASPSHMRNRVFSATCAYMGRDEDAKEEASPRIVNDGAGAPSRMRSTFGHGTVNMLAVGLVAAVMKAGAGGPPCDVTSGPVDCTADDSGTAGIGSPPDAADG